MHGAEAKPAPHFAVMPFPCTIMPRRPAFSGRYGKGRIFMRRNIIAALALLFWGAGLTAAKMKECRWVKPILVGQFEFTEWTPDNHLRHSRFLALREDKKPGDVKRQ
jgi:hypothetical protein